MHASVTYSLLLLGLASNISAQNDTFNPASIPSDQRHLWCRSELQVCSTLCDGSFQSSNDNTCNQNTLATTCICADGSEPDLSQFTNTVPTFECQYRLAQCLNNATTTSGRNACAFQYICGDRVATQVPGAATTRSSVSSSRTAASASTSRSHRGQATSTSTSTSTIASSSTTTITPSRAWIAGPIIGAIVLVAAVAALIWILKRRRSRAKAEKWTRADQLPEYTEAELHAEPKEPEVSELAGQSRTAELGGGIYRHPVELHGSNRLVELDAT